MTGLPPSGEHPEPGPAAAVPHVPARAPTARLVATLVLALVAVSGILCGVALDRLVLSPRFHARGWMFRPRVELAPGAARRELRERFARSLDLTADQSARIDTIMAHQLVRMHAIRDSVRPALDSVIVDTRRQIEAVLTPEQRERFRAMPFRPGGRALRGGGRAGPRGDPRAGGPGPG